MDISVDDVMDSIAAGLDNEYDDENDLKYHAEWNGQFLNIEVARPDADRDDDDQVLVITLEEYRG